MGSLFKTSTPAPTPPAPPSTVRDEVNGGAGDRVPILDRRLMSVEPAIFGKQGPVQIDPTQARDGERF